MTELEQYIATGVIESYCLGNLPDDEALVLLQKAAQFPELQEEIDKTLGALNVYVAQHEPSPALKEKTLQFLDRFLPEEVIDVNNPPLIHHNSDARAWQQATAHFQPEMDEGNYALCALKDTPEVSLHLVWLSGTMMEDEHPADAFQESFLIFEGACECNFGGKIVRFYAGDYFEVPSGVKHTIVNISATGLVRGVVQRRLAA